MIMRGNPRCAGAGVPARCGSHREDKLCKAQRGEDKVKQACERNLQEEEGEEVESGQIIIRVLVLETSGANSKSKGLVCRSQEAVVIGHSRKGGRRSMARLCLGPLGGCCKKSRTEVRGCWSSGSHWDRARAPMAMHVRARRCLRNPVQTAKRRRRQR